ncbi:hypothetical protein AVME950_21460 [Acidovorax sp. SUPP950]|uniref:hypothetical protein n=1 Tax=Acidovorax sp. SUPP950 TaxID=511901 RepID=UPI0023D51BD0|nr:hypothetical protein [Acidovorax sp. SUPP950]GKS77510.1 hypothetical protein AVME950_21460 [Acidovorax sp. SUPP950]
MELEKNGSYYTNLVDVDEASMVGGRDESASSASADQDPLFDVLRPMAEGEHLCIPVGQCGSNGNHALLISVSRLDADQARVSVFNSEGWQCQGGTDRLDDAPAISRSMPMDRVYGLLKALDGSVLKPPPDDSLIRADWEVADAGAPLLSWLQDGGSAASEVKVASLRQPRQKAVYCALESRFAWLATVLPEADYKLVKAHALNVLAENASIEEDRAEVLGVLGHRVTVSLSGYAMSAKP